MLTQSQTIRTKPEYCATFVFTEDPFIFSILQKSIQYHLSRYIKPYVTTDVYRSMYPVGTGPGALYGMAKVHKNGIPLCPVIGMVNTRNRALLDTWIR